MEPLASTNKDDFQSRRLSIIDFSSEDDSLLGLPPRFLHEDTSSESQDQRSVELFEHVDDSKLEKLFEPVDANRLPEIPESDELMLLPSECLEPERIRKNAKYNLRKSLAWDSAFFTCEGVLDADELSTMISIEKSQKRMLPEIQEEVHRSSDSISTLGSDTLTLESVDMGLFDDVRASIQRSRRPVKLAGESSRVGRGVRETKLDSGLKKVDLASQLKVKPKVAAKKPSISIQNPGKSAGPVAAYPLLSKAVVASGESTSSDMKQTKVLDKPIPTSTRMVKRASLGGELLKAEKDKAKILAGRATPVSKLPVGLRNVPRPSKPSSLTSSVTTKMGPTSSFKSSGSTSSVVKSSKSPLNSMKRKTDCKTGNPTNSSRPNPKTPSRITSGEQADMGKFRLSAQFMPSPKISSSISPASSISDWSAESVSSISSSQPISCSSRDSVRKKSSNMVSMEFDAAQSLDRDGKQPVGSVTQTSGLLDQGTVRASAGTVGLPPTSKPSGLRLPSPKIGFFDGVKSAVRTPKRSVPCYHKAGDASVSSRGSEIKSKLGKFNPEKAAKVNAANPDSARPPSTTKPKISLPPEASDAVTKEAFSDLVDVESCPATTPKAKTDIPLKINQDYQMMVEAAGDFGYDVGIRDKDTTETKHSAHDEDVNKNTRVSVDHVGVSDSSSISNLENLTLSEVVRDVKQKHIDIKNDDLKSDTEDQGITRTNEMVFGGAVTSHQKSNSEDNGGISELNSHQDVFVCLDKDDFPNNLLNSIESTSSIENSSSMRIPFSAKDSLCNIGESFDAPKVSMVSEEEKSQLPLSMLIVHRE